MAGHILPLYFQFLQGIEIAAKNAKVSMFKLECLNKVTTESSEHTI